MTTKLLDTTFLIHYWRGEGAVAAYLDDHESETEFLTTTINLKEIAVGRAIQGHLDRRDILGTFDWVRIVPFDIEDAFVAGELEAPLHLDEGVDRNEIAAIGADVLIAAVSRDYGAPVVTKNVDDFERFEGVSVETY